MLRLPAYRYHRPRTLEAALELLAEHGDAALPIAGGTDLIPNLKHRLFAPANLVALKQIDELRGFAEDRVALSIGAGETLTAVARHPRVQRLFPALARAAGSVAGPQLRNMGTLGGNVCLDTRCTYYNQTHFWRQALGFCLKKDGEVCHVTKVGRKCVAAHSADTPPVLMALGASVELASADGRRSVPVTEFFVADGISNTVRRPGELVTRITVPMPAPGLRTSYQKLRQRNSIDFPLLTVAAAAELDGDGMVQDLRIVVSALGARPRMMSGLDRIAAGQRLGSEAVVEAVAERAFQQCHPLTNIIVDPNWRRAMVPVYVRRAIRQLAEPSIAA